MVQRRDWPWTGGRCREGERQGIRACRNVPSHAPTRSLARVALGLAMNEARRESSPGSQGPHRGVACVPVTATGRVRDSGAPAYGDAVIVAPSAELRPAFGRRPPNPTAFAPRARRHRPAGAPAPHRFGRSGTRAELRAAPPGGACLLLPCLRSLLPARRCACVRARPSPPAGPARPASADVPAFRRCTGAGLGKGPCVAATARNGATTGSTEQDGHSFSNRRRHP